MKLQPLFLMNWTIENPANYDVKEQHPRRFGFITKPLYRLIRKLGFRVYNESWERSIDFWKIPGERLREVSLSAIRQSVDDIRRFCRKSQNLIVIVGASYESQLVKEIYNEFQGLPFFAYDHTFTHGLDLYGCRLIFLPWVDGFVVLPEDALTFNNKKVENNGAA